MRLKANYLRLSGYRLPTEAEWEYACRAGAATSWSHGEGEELVEQYGWYLRNSKQRTWPVGSLKPNDLGLFDMHGNVHCMCQNLHNAYPQNQAGEVTADLEDVLTIGSDARLGVRGGYFGFNAGDLRSAHRNFTGPGFHAIGHGFRPARTLP
jgi:formylglycine-generating enzyme required for sulfatase activity